MTVYGLYYVAGGRRELCESYWEPRRGAWVCCEAHRTLAEAQARVDANPPELAGHYVAGVVRPGVLCYFTDDTTATST